MAKKWLPAEVAEAVKNGDKSAMMDFGRRFPLATGLISRAMSGDQEAFVEFLNAIPEKVSLQSINNILKEDVEPYEEDEEETPKNKKEKKSSKKSGGKKKVKKEEPEDDDEDDDEEDEFDISTATKKSELKGVSKKAMRDYLKEEGVAKKDRGGTELEDIIKAVIKYNKKKAAEVEADDEGDEEKSFEDMSVKELKAKCKELGVKVKKGMDKDDIIEALESADDVDEDDDEEEEKPKKKSSKKSSKKKAKKEEPEDDDDDDDEDEEDEEEEKPKKKSSKKGKGKKAKKEEEWEV